MAKSDTSGARTKELADHWCLSLRTTQKFLADGAPLDSEIETIRWVAAKPASWRAKATKPFLARVTKLRIAHEAQSGGAIVSDPRFAAFMAGYKPGSHDSLRIGDIKRMEAFARHLLNLALQSGDAGEIQSAIDKHQAMADLLRREEAADAKLGRELGDQISRAEDERLDAALAAALYRAIDASLPSLCRRLVGLTHAEFVREQLEPALLSAAFLQPLAEAARLATDQRLPAWKIENFFRAAATYLESGRAQLTKILTENTFADGDGI